MASADIRRLAAALAATVALAGCATQRAPSPHDPFEPMNRAVFEFNDTADRFVFKPVAEGYRLVLPEIVRTGVRNVFSNLRDPWIALNQLMQGKVELALSDGWRFIVNSTFGIGGIFDIATDMRLPKHNEDFGQTLAVWGFDFGPYLVLPIWGPSSVRDGVGLVADAYAYLPWWIPEWANLANSVEWQWSLTAVDFVNIRANLLDATDILEQAALDRYAFVRDAYFQRRRNLIYDGNPPPEGGAKGSSAAPAAPGTGLARAPGAPASPGEPQAEPASAAASAASESGSTPPARSLAPEVEPSRPAASAAPSEAAQVVEPKIPANYDAVLASGRVRVAVGY